MTWQIGTALAAGGILLVSVMLLWNAGLVCGRYDSRDRRALRAMLRWISLVTGIIGFTILSIAAFQSALVVVPIIMIAAPFAAALSFARITHVGTAMLKAILLWLSLLIAGISVLLLLALSASLLSGSRDFQTVGGGVAAMIAILDAAVISGAAGLAMWLQIRSSREQSLIWLLATAEEKGAPLHDAAHAFADENNDDYHARELSLYLQAGASLPEALRRTGISLPLDARLAVDVGSRINLFGQCLRDVMSVANNIDSLLRENVERLLYFMAVILATTLGGVFLVVKIFPVLQKISNEFEIANTGVLDSMATAGPWFLALSVIVILVLSFISYLGALYYIDCLPANLVGVDLLTKRLDGSRLLRVLAAAVSQGRSLASTLRILTLYFPRTSVRARLFRTGQLVSSGSHWIDSLRATSLITDAECAVMKTAEKAGNLDWAMNSLAAMSAQRIAYRMRFWFSLLFPLIICAAALIYMLMAVSLFIPLASLITALSET